MPAESEPEKLDFKKLERTCAILEAIAAQYEPHSAEQQAIRTAALALHAVYANSSLYEQFADLQQNHDAPLTPEQIAHLRSMGIEDADLE